MFAQFILLFFFLSWKTCAWAQFWIWFPFAFHLSSILKLKHSHLSYETMLMASNTMLFGAIVITSFLFVAQPIRRQNWKCFTIYRTLILLNLTTPMACKWNNGVIFPFNCTRQIHSVACVCVLVWSETVCIVMLPAKSILILWCHWNRKNEHIIVQ